MKLMRGTAVKSDVLDSVERAVDPFLARALRYRDQVSYIPI
jgi:hypothetical protein